MKSGTRQSEPDGGADSFHLQLRLSGGVPLPPKNADVQCLYTDACPREVWRGEASVRGGVVCGSQWISKVENGLG